MKIIKLSLIIFGFITFYNGCFATSLGITIDGGTNKSYYYNESVTMTATATFPDDCTSTGITWTKSVPGFPFPTIVTVSTDSSYSLTVTEAKTYTVTANCSASSVVAFVYVTIKDPIVNAGVNSNYNSGDLVNLSGSLEGANGCTYDYIWEQISGTAVTINNSFGNVFNTSFTGSYIFPSTGDEVKIKLKVTPQSCYYAGNTYSGTVTYTKTSTTGRRSRSNRSEDEATSIFSNSITLDNIDLKLNYIQLNSSMLQLFWNNIGGEPNVKYQVEYSTGKTFLNKQLFETTQSTYNLITNNLDFDSNIHYFRLKACYKEKCTPYSNTIKYVSDDYLNLPKYKDYYTITSFLDIFTSYDMLIDKYYTPYKKKGGIEFNTASNIKK